MTSEKTLATLEFTTVRGLLAERTSFTPGREQALELAPETDLAAAERLQDETAAAKALVRATPSAGLRGAQDIRDPLRRADLGGILDPEQLVAIAVTVRAAVGLFTDIHPYPPGLQRRLDGLLRSDLARYLQDPIVTQRGGRYVVPVKSEYRGAVKGIVHDSSASGATVFIEPLEVLEANNRVREAELAEQQEVQKILDGLSRTVERAGEDLHATLDALASLDVILAKAQLAEALESERPALNAEGRLDLIAARHPLLIEQGTPVVPIDVRLGTDFRVLVITGPNTGGKTVTLKTIGLLTLMGAAGLQVPAQRGSAVPVVRRIFADIGDEQSIAQSLSTFSSHLRNVVATLAEAEQGDLALLDEVGAGTDPDEGAALAMAVLETLLARGVLVAASTHYPELKAFALNTPGVTNASVEFDAETLRPTYRVHVGLPGASNAFAIASRLGLAQEVLAKAELHRAKPSRSESRVAKP